jgi:hypothetical protein
MSEYIRYSHVQKSQWSFNIDIVLKELTARPRHITVSRQDLEINN